MNEGYNIAWVSTDLAADGTPISGDGEYGRIMFQRFEVPLDALGNPGAPVAAGIDGIVGLDGHTASAANDGAVQFSAFGRNPSTAALHTFETAIIWVEPDGAGGEKITGVALDDVGNIIPTDLFADISGIYSVTAGTNPQVVSAGAVNFGIAGLPEPEWWGIPTRSWRRCSVRPEPASTAWASASGHRLNRSKS